MTTSCAHEWLIRRESLRKAGWRVRVRCRWCKREQLWKLWQAQYAANVSWWRKTHPDSRA